MQDNFNRTIDYARISVTDLCNLRCLYCMPSCGVCKLEHIDILSLEDIYKIASTLNRLGFDKFRITGGEPLVRKNVIWLIKELSKLKLTKLGLTTNGTYLKDYAEQLAESHVTSLNVSLDTLDSKKYEYLTRGGDINLTKQGLYLAKDCGLNLKLNAVLMRGINDEEIKPLIDFATSLDAQMRFIELMPVGVNKSFYSSHAYTIDDMLANNTQIRETKKHNGTAKTFEYAGQKFGVIAPLSRKFCAECNRIRLSADGKILPCLHSAEKFDLKPYLNDDEALKKAIANAIAHKPQAHHIESGLSRNENMNEIGG